MNMENHGEIILKVENRTTQRKTCPSVSLSTTDPLWTYQGENSGLLSERSATNRLGHETVLTFLKLKNSISIDDRWSPKQRNYVVKDIQRRLPLITVTGVRLPAIKVRLFFVTTSLLTQQSPFQCVLGFSAV
jgi:hypothetical protein